MENLGRRLLISVNARRKETPINIKPKFKLSLLLFVLGAAQGLSLDEGSLAVVLKGFEQYQVAEGRSQLISTALDHPFPIAKTAVGGVGTASSYMRQAPRAIDHSFDRVSTALTSATGIGFLHQGTLRVVSKKEKSERYSNMMTLLHEMPHENFNRLFDRLEADWNLYAILCDQFPKDKAAIDELLLPLQNKLRHGPLGPSFKARVRNYRVDLTTIRLLLVRLRAQRLGPEAAGKCEEEWKKYEALLVEFSQPEGKLAAAPTLERLEAILGRMESTVDEVKAKSNSTADSFFFPRPSEPGH